MADLAAVGSRLLLLMLLAMGGDCSLVEERPSSSIVSSWVQPAGPGSPSSSSGVDMVATTCRAGTLLPRRGPAASPKFAQSSLLTIDQTHELVLSGLAAARSSSVSMP